MSYINVAEWTSDQVTDWLKGLDNIMYNYVSSFTNNEVGGKRLLNIRAYELEQLGMHALGHQEIVLEAVENLRNCHYNLDKENLQFMAMHLATAARSLTRQLANIPHCDESKLETQILSDITCTIGTIKPLISWLDRTPFQGQRQFTEICRNLLRLGLEMATIAQRDRFVERPVEQIRATAETLDRLANYIIQDISDPMLLQPSSLNLITFKKRESELGFEIDNSYSGVHRVIDIKNTSPAHNSGKIEVGDEIVQINYQTVVGWPINTVLMQLHESASEVLLTLKKRPKHTKVYGQIYMQPYRLPSKKRAIGSRWGDNFTNSRTGFLTVQDNDFNLPLTSKSEKKKPEVTCSSDTDSSCSDILTPTDTKASDKDIRLYYPKPRAVLQRRYTICGDQPHTMKHLTSFSLFNENRPTALGIPPSPNLRDKSVSFGFGLEVSPRPTTCIGFAAEGALRKLTRDQEAINKPNKDNAKKSNPGISKVVRFEGNMNLENYQRNEQFTCNVQDTILETFEPIPFADEDDSESLQQPAISKKNSENEMTKELLKKTEENRTSLIEAINLPVVGRRGKLDIRSNSTPTYDQSGEDSDTPPAIEPRKEFLVRIPPVPPPRPRKPKDVSIVVPVPPPKPLNMQNQQMKLSPADPTDDKVSQRSIGAVDVSEEKPIGDVNELHTPYKSKTLTLKKKHTLVAKRRNINLKVLGIGDIQGHLYRRTKDRRGVTFWARYYLVMLDTILYGFRSKEAPKANFVIFLPGFTVSIAKEVHSKPFAFKVYHPAKTFYFAAESQSALNQWFEFICQATLRRGNLNTVTNYNASDSEAYVKDLFSETEASEDENELKILSQNDLSLQSTKLCTLKNTAVQILPAKSDRRYLGSLRKLTKGSLHFKGSSNNDKKAQSDIPVPTDQYRSYRKVPGGSFGIQIGPNTPGYHERPHNLLTSHTVNNELPAIAKKELTPIIASTKSVLSTTNYESNSEMPNAAAPELLANIKPKDSIKMSDEGSSNSSTNIKKKSHNYLHASNPNLLEIDFQTSKNLDYSFPKISLTNSWDAHQNTQFLGTLKDLMLQKQEEEAQEMYNNRVLLGVEKLDERKRILDLKCESNASKMRQNCITEKNACKSKTQFRSLPKTPDYDISFKPDDEDIRRTRTKEGLKLRDFGYELISGDEPTGIESVTPLRQNSNASASSNEHIGETSATTINKSRSFLMSQPFLLYTHKQKKADQCANSSDKRFSSIKKKAKLDRAKLSNELLFENSKQSTGLTMTLPYNKKANVDFEAAGKNPTCIKKSHTYNNDLKDKIVKNDTHRKNSMPIFSKLSSSSTSTSNAVASPIRLSNEDESKEKKLLESPILHRTVFVGNRNHQNNSSNNNVTCREREYDQEIFLQVVFPNLKKKTTQQLSFNNRNSTDDNISAPLVAAPPPPVLSHDSSQNISNKAEFPSVKPFLPEYPHMKCPPVFEPEFYSLTDANTSLNLQINSNVDNEGNSEEDINQ